MQPHPRDYQRHGQSICLPSGNLLDKSIGDRIFGRESSRSGVRKASISGVRCSSASSKSSVTRMSSASTVRARITIPDTVGRMEPAARIEGAIGGGQTVASGSRRPEALATTAAVGLS